jgi:hypothetical protein
MKTTTLVTAGLAALILTSGCGGTAITPSASCHSNVPGFISCSLGEHEGVLETTDYTFNIPALVIEHGNAWYINDTNLGRGCERASGEIVATIEAPRRVFLSLWCTPDRTVSGWFGEL